MNAARKVSESFQKWADVLSAQSCSYDLYDGTAVDPTNTRVVYFNTDIMRGIHAALNEEAGPAWRVILKSSGKSWGQTYYRLFARQVKRMTQTQLARMPVHSFLQHICALFSCNGWGVTEFDLSDSYGAGIVRVRLHNSMMVDALDQLDEKVDFLIAGMLAGFFSEIAGSDLDCVEVSSPRSGVGHSEFLIAAQGRLDDVDDWLEEGCTEVDELVQRIGNIHVTG